MILYKLTIDKNGYHVDEIEVERQQRVIAWYQNVDMNFSVLESSCYTKEKLESDRSINFEHVYYADEPNSDVYIAYSIVKPDEKVKAAFVKEIQARIDITIKDFAEQLESATRRYSNITAEKERFLSFIQAPEQVELEQDEELEM